jgi:hypothetical protein
MEKQNQLLKGIESLSEQEKLELFKIEELETRLEMAGNIGGGIVDRLQINIGCHPTNYICRY